MNKRYLRRWMTGLLCAALIISNVISTGIYVSAANIETNVLMTDGKLDDNESPDVIEKDVFDDVTEEKEDKEENEGENENQDAEGLDEDRNEPQEDVTDTETPDESVNEPAAGEDEPEVQDETDAELPEEESNSSEEADN